MPAFLANQMPTVAASAASRNPTIMGHAPFPLRIFE